MTVATLALTVKRSNHSARSHLPFANFSTSLRVSQDKVLNAHARETSAALLIVFLFSVFITPNCFICRPSDCTVSENAGIEPQTVATFDIDSLTL
jgi:hypothetical protein